MFRFPRIIAIIVACTAGTGLAESGVARDKATGQPIAGAIVVAEWNGHLQMAVQPFSTCYKVAVAISDARGRFDLPAFSWDLRPYLMGRTRGVRIFATGRRESPESDAHSLRIVMEPDTRPPAEQMGRILDPLRSRGCEGNREANFLPLLVAVRRELAGLPPSAESRKQAEWLTYEIEELELGEAEAERRSRERLSREQKRLNINIRCAAPGVPSEHSCCFGFGDARGYSALEVKLAAARIDHSRREASTELCVRRSDRDDVRRLAAEVVSGYR